MVDKTEISAMAIDDKTIEKLSLDTAEKLATSLDEKILTVSQVPQKKFKTNYTDNSKTYDAEVNSGDYIVDDSQYIDFKKLLQRSAQCEKSAVDFLSQIPVVDNVGGIDESDLSDVIKNTDVEVPEVQSEEISTSETESSQEAQEVSNPVDNSPDVSSVAETNGK